eukprot:383121-Hanusia_phi.AAC.1
MIGPGTGAHHESGGLSPGPEFFIITEPRISTVRRTRSLSGLAAEVALAFIIKSGAGNSGTIGEDKGRDSVTVGRLPRATQYCNGSRRQFSRLTDQ